MKELENQKLELVETDKRHQETISKLERKFFEDKIRLQKEANRKISELAANAHKVNMDILNSVGGCNEFRRNVKRCFQRKSENVRGIPISCY